MKLPRDLLLMIVFLLAASPLSGCYYLSSESVPEVSNYELGLAELRSLARSRPGDLPIEVRLERVVSHDPRTHASAAIEHGFSLPSRTAVVAQ